jgi:hypothetical protein
MAHSNWWPRRLWSLFGPTQCRNTEPYRRRSGSCGRLRASTRKHKRPPFLEPLEDRVVPSTITWDGQAGDNNWGTALNWSTDTLPGSTDDVVIPDLPGTPSITSSGTVSVQSVSSYETINIAGGSFTVAAASTLNAGLNLSGGTATFNLASVTFPTLVLSSGTLGGSANYTVTGTMSWNAGYLSGTGTMTIAAGASLTMDTGGGKQLNQAVYNQGTATWNNGGISGSGAFTNQSGGIFNVQSNSSIGVPFTNQPGATFNQVSGTTTILNPKPFNNDGTVNLTGGTLLLGGGGTSNGSFSVQGGATLDFNMGTFTVGATSTVTGAGAVTFTSSNVTLSGGYTVSGSTTISGGTATLNMAAVAFPTLVLSGYGGLTGTANITIPSGGSFSWSGGSHWGSSTTTIASGATLALSGASTKTLSYRTLIDAGTTTQSGTGNLIFGNGASLAIQAGGLYDLQSDSGFSLGAGTGSVMVAGTLQKSGGTGTSTVATTVNNTGTVSVSSGTLSFSGTVSQVSGNLLTGGTCGLLI